MSSRPPGPPGPTPPFLPGQRVQSVQQSVSLEVSAGPLPPPEALARYNEIVPGAADRILQMAEAQGEHRRDLEKKVIEGNLAAQARGQHYGLLVSLFVMGGGIYLAAQGREVAGLATLALAVAGLVAALVIAKSKQAKELGDKRKALAEGIDRARGD